MARIKTRRRSAYTIEDEDSGRSFEVDIEPHDGITPIVRILPDGRAVVGYAAHDEDCSAPLKIGRDTYEPDGSGELITLERRDKSKGMSEFNRDQYGNPNWDEEDENPDKGNPYAVLLDKREHGSVDWRVIQDPYEDRDFERADGVWIPDDSCLEHIESSGIKGSLPDGCTVNYESKHAPNGKAITRPPKEGETPYFTDGTCIDERYHNIITITFPDGMKYPGFDSPIARPTFKTFTAAYEFAAKWLKIDLDEEVLKQGRRKVAVKCAESAMEEYTKWCNGDCYGHVVIAFGADGEMLDDKWENPDTCWGYIGSEYAEERVTEEVDNMVNYLLKQTGPKLPTAVRPKRKLIRPTQKP